MENTIRHVGILGMHWGRRKSSGPTSSEHDQAVTNLNPFRGSVKGYFSSRRRLALERSVQKIQEKGRYTNKQPAKSMTNAEIKTFLHNPVMKKSLKEINKQDTGRVRKAGKIVAALLSVGLMLHYAGVDRAIGQTVGKVLIEKHRNFRVARDTFKVGKDVIDLQFH